MNLTSTDTEHSASSHAEAELHERIKALESSFESSSESLSVAKQRQRDIQNSIEHENSQYFALKQTRSEIKNSIAMIHRLHEELTLRIQKFELDNEAALRTLSSR